MNTKRALRLALYYRGLSAASFVVGVGIALVGLSVGLGETLSILASDFPSRTDEAMAAANLPVAFGAAVVGVLVWQVGKWAAFFRTIEKAVDDPASSTAAEASPNGRRTAPREGKTAEADGDSSASRQDPIVPSSQGGSTDQSASPGAVSNASGDARSAGPDRRAGDPIDGDATAGDDPISGGATAGSGSGAGDGPVTDSRTGSPKPHDEGDDAAAASGKDGSAATLADDANSVFDGGAADAPADAVSCGECGYPNKEGVSFCANCGTEL